MGVTVITNRKDRIANGVLTAFDFDFLIYQDSDLLVYEVEVDEDGFTVSSVLKTLGAHYTVTIDPTVEGGTVNTLYTPADGKIIRMIGNVPETQETDFPLGTGFSETRIRTAVDKLTRLVNQVRDRLNFAILRPIYEGDTDVMTLTDLDAAVVSAEADKVAAQAANTSAQSAKTAAEAARDAALLVAAAYVPTGVYFPYGGTAAPSSAWLLCNGAAVSRTTYAALFAVIGTAYGVGDGSTTFNLPDLRDRFPLGKGTTFSTLGAVGGATTKNLQHTHAFTTGTPSGSPTNVDGSSSPVATSSHTHTGTTDAGGSTTQDIMNPYQVGNYIIKT